VGVDAGKLSPPSRSTREGWERGGVRSEGNLGGDGGRTKR